MCIHHAPVSQRGKIPGEPSFLRTPYENIIDHTRTSVAFVVAHTQKPPGVSVCHDMCYPYVGIRQRTSCTAPYICVTQQSFFPLRMTLKHLLAAVWWLSLSIPKPLVGSPSVELACSRLSYCCRRQQKMGEPGLLGDRWVTSEPIGTVPMPCSGQSRRLLPRGVSYRQEGISGR